MFYYAYIIEWSQTDSDFVIIKSDPKGIADKLKAEFPGAKYFQFIGKTAIVIV